MLLGPARETIMGRYAALGCAMNRALPRILLGIMTIVALIMLVAIGKSYGASAAGAMLIDIGFGMIIGLLIGWVTMDKRL